MTGHTKLVDFETNSLTFTNSFVYFCDSHIVLHCIHSSKRLSELVAHSVLYKQSLASISIMVLLAQQVIIQQIS